MVDSIQRSSSNPLPRFQSEQGSQDPMPLDAPKEMNRVAENVKRTDGERNDADFEDYLNQTGISTLEKSQQQNKTFDPVEDVVASSVYAQPDDKTQF